VVTGEDLCLRRTRPLLPDSHVPRKHIPLSALRLIKNLNMQMAFALEEAKCMLPLCTYYNLVTGGNDMF
jgi:hypothetical protein